jgi:lysophospholipase L1-like esterase
MSSAAPSTSPVRGRFLRGVAAMFVAALVAFGACEIAARMIFPAPPDRTRQPPVAYLYDAELRYVLAPNQQGWIDDGLVTVNAAGFRSRTQTDLPKPHGRYRIVVLGDSVAIGMGVADDEPFAARVEQLLRQRFPGKDLDVINLGVPGYDTRQEVGLLRRHVAQLQPDLVLVGFYSNDVPDVLEGEVTPSGTPIAAGPPRAGQVLHMDPTNPSFADRYLRKSRIIFIAGRTFNRARGAGESGMARLTIEMNMVQGNRSPQIDRAWSIIEMQLQALQALARSSGFDCAIVALPPRELVSGQVPGAAYLSQIHAVADPVGFPVIDPIPAMIAKRTQKDGLYIPYDRNHPDAQGHRAIAEAIVAQIQDRVASR